MSIYLLHGTVRDKTGTLAARKVYVLNESGDTLDTVVTSDAASGEFAAAVSDSGSRLIVCSGESDRNAIVYSGVAPVASTEHLPTGFTQSSTYPGVTSANTTRMRDSNHATGTGTNIDSPSFVRADLGAVKSVAAVVVAGGDVSGWGTVAEYLNGAELQYQSGSDWLWAATITGVTDTGPAVEQAFAFPSINARYWRLARDGGYVAVTEFRLYGIPA